MADTKHKGVLFVCSANVGRSQMAEVFFNELSHSSDAESAGASSRIKGYEGRLVKDAGPVVTSAMLSEGIDIGNKTSKQLTEKMAESASLIVYMADDAEMPDYLKKNSKVRIWRIQDPHRESYERTVEIVLQIKGLVEKLVAEIYDDKK